MEGEVQTSERECPKEQEGGNLPVKAARPQNELAATIYSKELQSRKVSLQPQFTMKSCRAVKMSLQPQFKLKARLEVIAGTREKNWEVAKKSL